jgi:hypothetical protein
MAALATTLTVTELFVGRPKSSGPVKLTCPCTLDARALMIRKIPQKPTEIFVLNLVILINFFSL